MSWFARSIANTLQQLDINEDNNNTDQNITTDQQNTDKKNELEEDEEDEDSPLSPGRGVKEDLSEITKTLTRKFWGVASFLAPPPSDEQSDGSDPDDDAVAPEPISGIRRDFAEISGRFRSGISKLSNNIDVSEITKIASNFLQMLPEGEAIGVTDEVVAFVRDITMHPETWLDFPLPDDEDDEEEFELSDAQQEHALAVESLAPRLTALRIELCPGYMSEGSFWKVYFVLLHPRLEPQAAQLLSTPEIVKARAALTQEMKARSNSQIKEEEESARDSFPYSEHKPASFEQEHSFLPFGTQSEAVPLEITSTQSTDAETEKRQIPSEEVQIVEKSVIQEEARNQIKPEDENVVEDKDEDDWLNEDNSENVTGTTTTTIPIENDEDVSFSDLEEDDGDVPTNYKNGSDSSTKDSRDWVQLGSDSSAVEHAGRGQVSGVHSSETKESNDWLDVDDIDVA